MQDEEEMGSTQDFKLMCQTRFTNHTPFADKRPARISFNEVEVLQQNL